MIKKQKAVVAVSGGMDSCVTAAIAAEEYTLAFAHFNYGQRTEQRELKAFNEIADYYNVTERLVMDLTHFTKIGGSSLTDANIEVSNADLKSNDVPTSYVPFRNANILSACTSWAEVIDAKAIFIGAVYEDATGYPDCRPEFYAAFQQTINEGTKPSTVIEVKTPIIHLSKSEIVQKGMSLSAPIHVSWSCYRNSRKACGVCDSCAFRLRGFQQVGLEDPIEYERRPNYLS